jgi:hypothetical protein
VSVLCNHIVEVNGRASYTAATWYVRVIGLRQMQCHLGVGGQLHCVSGVAIVNDVGVRFNFMKIGHLLEHDEPLTRPLCTIGSHVLS